MLHDNNCVDNCLISYHSQKNKVRHKSLQFYYYFLYILTPTINKFFNFPLLNVILSAYSKLLETNRQRHKPGISPQYLANI